MEKLRIVIAVLCMLLVNSASAQVVNSKKDSSKKQETIAQRDPAKSSVEMFDKEDRVELQIDQIPDLVRLTLERGKEFRGWHNATIYLDRANKQYTFHITDSTSATRTFKFDENGNILREESASTKSGRKQPVKKT